MFGPGKSYVGNIWHALIKAVEEAGEDANKDVVGADAKTRWFNAARTGGGRWKQVQTHILTSRQICGLLWI